MRALLLLCIFLLSLTSSLAQARIGAIFDQAQEFPDYFLPSNFAVLSPEKQASVVQERRALLEQAVQSITERMMIPIRPEGEEKVRPVFPESFAHRLVVYALKRRTKSR